MKSTHTPGPWEVEKGFRGPLGGPQETPYVAVLKDYGDGSHDVIADVCRQGEHTEANARLIAAAPDMLAELENIAFWLLSPATDANTLKAISLNIHAVIAKATKGG
jgi:hypothetical protein